MLIVPSIHPAALLRRSGGDKDLARFFQTVVADIRKARRLAYEHPQWDESCIWGRDASGRLKAIFPTLQELHAFRVAARGYDLAVDVETTGNSPLECRLICVGMASANGSYICVPFLKQGGSPYWSPDEGRLAWELVCQLMADSLTPKVLHNGSFDKLVMETFGAQLDYSADTMQATHCTDSELPLGLGFVATRHLDIAYWKDDAKGAERWLDLPDEQLRVYNCLPGTASVLTADGSAVRIDKLVRSRSTTLVRCLVDGKITALPITGWYRKRVSGQRWWALRLESSAKPLISTPDHRVMTSEGWKQAEEIRLGDLVTIPENKYSDLQMKATLGTLLGDSSLGISPIMRSRARASNGFSIIGTHSGPSGEMLAKLKSYFLDLNFRPAGIKKSTFLNTSPVFEYRGCSKYQLKPYYDLLFDESGCRRLRREVLDMLGPVGLAWWFMDDGCRQQGQLETRFKNQGSRGGALRRADKVCLAACRYPAEDVAVAVEWFREKYGPTTAGKDLVFRLGVEASRKFVREIEAFVIPEMRYKLPHDLSYRDFDYRVYAKPLPTPVFARVVDSAEYRPKIKDKASRFIWETRYCIDVAGAGNFFTPNALVHNCRDCLTTLRLKPILEAEVRRLGLWSLYQEEIAVCKMMTRATRRGLMMDFERRDSTTPGPDGKPVGLGPRLVLQRDEALSKLRMVAGSTGFDPQKPEHLRFLLFQQLKLPIVKETKTGLPSTDKDAMVMLALAADTQAQKYTISALTNWKVSQKKIAGWTGEWTDGAHVGGLPILGDGCLHPQWKMTPNTGRLASSPNAQNWGPDVKKLFRCAPGRKLTGVDLSQAELRNLGYEANDRFLLTAYAQGIDVHTANMAFYLKMRFADGHEQANPQTVEYIKQTIGQLYPGVTYESLPVVPKHREKASRTLTKIGEFACLAADTKVALLDGSKPICEVKTGDWTWCWNGKEYEHTRVVKAWSTGVRRCVRLTVVDGVRKQKTITLTPDHKMLMRDGSFKPAGGLQLGESLMPFRRWKTGLGYSMLDPTNDQSEVYEHRQVVKDASVVHHKNEVRSDNRPENLQSMSHKEHRNEHGPAEITPDGMRRRIEATKDRWSRDHDELVAKMTAARVASPAWRASTRARLKKAAATRAAKPRIPCARCGEVPVEKGLCPKCWRVKYAEDNPGWWRKYAKPRKKENHKVVSVEEVGDFEVWDIEVEHPAHNFALEKCVFVSNSNYRATAETVHAQIRAAKDPKTNEFFFADLPLSQVEALLMRKERARPDLVRWWRENQRKTETDGFQKCAISGRMRFFRGGFKVTEIANWKIQTGIASWMNKCMLEIQATYDKETGGDCLIVQQVHDALNADSADEYAERAGQVMEKVLGREFSLPGHPVARLPPDKAKYGTHLDEV